MRSHFNLGVKNCSIERFYLFDGIVSDEVFRLTFVVRHVLFSCMNLLLT